MKNILLTSFIIDFLVPVINIVNDEVKMPCLLNGGNQRTPLYRRQGLMEVGPKRDKNYNPNYGYEPYWAGGDWVFSKHATQAGPKGTTTTTCTVDCPQMYEEYGEVCGRNLTYFHKTFKTYCEMLKEDCTGRATICIVRQFCDGQLKRATLPPHMQDIMDLYKERHGPLKYNPTYGYEPYWEDGEWVFHDPTDEGSTTPMAQVCGEECPYLYKEIKHVCARLSSSQKYEGCYSWTGWYCWGDRLDDLTQGFTTFPTYCKFLDAQCRSPFKDKWIFVHFGKCIDPQELSFKPISVGQQLFSRVPYYFTELSKALSNHSLPGINFT